ncbi:MAG TPA: exodeoxyribonuclease VII small subunit [Polyangiaceae bacterium]|jgi:exodeoxyribonuclease VII small subunit|nr:exodeoxyribonuclease VII small subunit [Polyangiaceae bacterium]
MSEQSGDDKLSFEAAAERLAAIVRELESGDLSLEDSLRLFEEGVRVARAAQARLDHAERRVEELLGIDAEGQPRTRAFE